MDNSRKPFLRLLALLALALAPCIGYTAVAAPESYDRLIIKWRNLPQDELAEARKERGLGERVGRTSVRTQRIGGRMSVMRLARTLSGEELKAALASLRADPDVEFVEPDRRVHAHAFAPSDPLFAGQWYLQSVQPAAIRADAAWDTTHGASTVVIAVVDTGVRFEHPDLAGKFLPGYDFVSGESKTSFAVANDGNGWDPDPSDPGDFLTATDLVNPPFRGQDCGGGPGNDQPTGSSWHGTRVSGMIAANTDNALGIAGAGFNVRILPVRVLGKCGGNNSDVIAGMYWAAGMLVPPSYLLDPNLPPNPNPAQVINMSLGGVGPCDAAYRTAVQDITAHGVLVVVSAGNEGEAVDAPANCTGALGVAGLRHIGTKVGYSNLGSEVGIAAPAGNCVLVGPGDPCLFSLDTTSNDGFNAPGGSTYTNQIDSNIGTSFAAPQVAGAAGLMKAVNPALTPAVLIARVRATARPFPTTSDSIPTPPVCETPSVKPLQETECICTTAVCGAGMLDTGAAVIDALRPVALAQATGAVGIGRPLTLDGSQSGAAVGRAPLTYSWTVLNAVGGAATPMIQSANQAIATVESPAAGSYTVRLTVTDNVGATDTADVTVTAAPGGGTGSTSPPPSSGSGGGGTAPGLLVLLAGLSLVRTLRHSRARI